MTPEKIIELAGKATPQPWEAGCGSVASWRDDGRLQMEWTYNGLEVGRLNDRRKEDEAYIVAACNEAPDYARRLVRLQEIGPGIVRALKDCGYWNEARELGALLEAGTK